MPPTSTATAARPGLTGAFDRYFSITERGSTIGREVRGGLVTFFAMSYIIVLNPIILGTVPDGTGAFIGGSEADATARVAAATALVAGVMSVLVGVVARFPLAMAAGLGLNAVVAYSIAALPEVTWADAMGIVVLEGLILLVLVATGFRQAVFSAVPRELKTAISVGIGLFIAFIGVVNAGFVRPGGGTPVTLGIDGSLASWPLLVFVVGLMTAIVLWIRQVRGALLISIVAATVLAFLIEAFGHVSDGDATGWASNLPVVPASLVQAPDLSLLGQFSLLGSVEKIGFFTVVLLAFTLLLADFFDTMGTMVAVGAQGGLLDAEGNPPRTKQILIVDSIGAIAGGAGSVSSNTAYIESSAGVGEGARTGLASVVTGAAFLLATFFAPVVNMVPAEAATPVLVLVGFMMMSQISGIDWRNLEAAIPAFLVIVMMPFTYSITDGIGAGFVAFVLIKVFMGKARQVHPLMWVVSILFIVYFLRGPIQSLVG
ncbi:NCS2 family permease [Serinibacter salmoneus]|uniref:AGZA family xanthine/uracil permease-like MFS transporter n=1 Tax=Serinibacter salmoneus TaxID=556530 RepID=A0A2A9D291_9MICO|nr:NCS2 family permease [Serinibacter salmoneus]PFG20817.1 AGZA family xanthine/uracil permease-like MFS transporter [Serinibacter salmoneus]